MNNTLSEVKETQYTLGMSEANAMAIVREEAVFSPQCLDEPVPSMGVWQILILREDLGHLRRQDGGSCE